MKRHIVIDIDSKDEFCEECEFTEQRGIGQICTLFREQLQRPVWENPPIRCQACKDNEIIGSFYRNSYWSAARKQKKEDANE